MQARSWAIQHGHLPKLCDAISLNAPSNAADARLRWEFLMVRYFGILCGTAHVTANKYQCYSSAADVSRATVHANSAAMGCRRLLDLFEQHERSAA
jgi:hypothetical protein